VIENDSTKFDPQPVTQFAGHMGGGVTAPPFPHSANRPLSMSRELARVDSFI